MLKLLDPYRWLIGALIAAAVAGSAMWYRTSLIEKGREEVRAEWKKASAQAQTEQDQKTDAAEKTLTVEVEVVRTVYRDRTKEVIKYVPAPATHCPADDEFVRLFNGTAGR